MMQLWIFDISALVHGNHNMRHVAALRKTEVMGTLPGKLCDLKPIQTALLRFLHFLPPVKCSLKLASSYSNLVHSKILGERYKEPCRPIFPGIHKPGGPVCSVVPLYQASARSAPLPGFSFMSGWLLFGALS